jgi:hypothetical protein
MVCGVDERWQLAVVAASRAGVVARLVFSTGTSARSLYATGLISESELAEYEEIPVERRAVWEQTDLLERSNLPPASGAGTPSRTRGSRITEPLHPGSSTTRPAATDHSRKRMVCRYRERV